MNIVIVGRGKVGRALHSTLREEGSHRVTLMGKRPDRDALRAAKLVVLAVPDDQIQAAASAVAQEIDRGTSVVHCAGARTAEELQACRARKASVAVMHPVVSFASVKHRPSLEGKTFVSHGDKRALTAVRAIAKACGARVVVARTDDPVYHAAAALAANGAASLGFVAVRLLERIGIGKRDAERAIGGMVESVGRNIANVGVPDALTGPVVRGDDETVARHRRALRRRGSWALGAYDAVLPMIIATAEQAGLARSRALALRRLLRDPP